MFVEPNKIIMTMPRYYEGYQDDDSNNAGTALLTFVLGAVAGVAAGMLLAPSSGQESRRKIATAATINKVTRKANGGSTTPNPTDQFNNL
jgi:hypothetical protein